MFVYDGTGVRLLGDEFQGRTGSRARDLVNFNNTILFSADDGSGIRTLFSFDGKNVSNLSSSIPQERSYNVSDLSSAQFTSFDGRVYFRADGVSAGMELFSFDEQAVKMAADINQTDSDTGVPGGSNPTDFAVFQGVLYFGADDGVHGQELYSFDGRSARLVADIRPESAGAGSGHSYPSALTVLQDLLIFSANDGRHGEELYVYDGRNVRLIADIYPGQDAYGRPNSSAPRGFVRYGDFLVFTAEDRESVGGVYAFDGREVTPVHGEDDLTISPGNIVSSYRFTGFQGGLYFSAHEEGQGQELWRISGNR